MTPATIFLTDLFLKASVVLVVAHLLLLSLRRASAGTRHLVISSAVIALLALPFTTVMFGVIELPVLDLAEAATPIPAERLMIRAATSDDPSELAEGAAEQTSIAADETTGSEPAPVVSASGMNTRRETTVTLPLISLDSVLGWVRTTLTGPTVLLVLWLAGTLALVGQLLVGAGRVQRIVDRARPVSDGRALALVCETTAQVGLDREPMLFISPDLSVPVVWGFTSPVLILPLESKGWSDDRCRAVLLHELAHVARRDGVTLILMRIAIALYWINPLVWTATRLSRRYCERACDDIVIEGGIRPSEYADHLLAVAQTIHHREQLTTVTLAMSRRSEIEGRLLAILHPDLRRGSISRRASITAALIAAVLVITVSCVRLTAEDHDEKVTSEDLWLEEILDPDLEVSVRESSASAGDSDLWTARGEQDPDHPEWNENPNWNTNWNSNSNWNVSSAEKRDEERRLESKLEREKQKYPKKAEQTEGARLWETAWNAHQSDRFDQSIPLFMKTAQLGYRTQASLYNVACGYAMQGDAERAVAWLEKAVENDFDDWSLLRRDSDLDPIQSTARFQAFVEALPVRHDEREKRSKSRNEKVLEQYERLRSARSTDASEWGETGRHLLGLRQFEEAEAALRRSIELSSAPPVIAMYNMACVEALHGNQGEALSWLDRAIESGLDRTDKMRSDPDLRSIRGAGFERLVRKSRLLSIEEFMNGHDDDDSLAVRRARWQPAIERYSAYVSSNSASGRAWWNLGWALHASGRYSEAIDSFQRALNLGYRTANSSYNIACGHARLGQRDLAFQWLERASSLGFEMGDRIQWDDDLASLRDDCRAEKIFGSKPAKR